MQSISKFNVGNLKEIEKLHLYDFGIYLELEPDEEEKAQVRTKYTNGVTTKSNIFRRCY